MAILKYTIFQRVADFGWKNYWWAEMLDIADATLIGDALANFHRNIQPGFVEIQRVTWNQRLLTGLGPIHTLPGYPATGTLGGSPVDYMPAGNVAWIVKTPEEGNPGHVPVRFCMLKSDVIPISQGSIYNPGGTFLEAFDDARTILNLALAGQNAKILIGGSTPATTHDAVDLAPGVPGYLDVDKGHYNHASP